LNKFRNKELEIFVYKYSINVATQQLYNLFLESNKPKESDRAGAATNTKLFTIKNKLKDKFSNDYDATDTNYLIWATYIARQPEQEQERLCNIHPPVELIGYFPMKLQNEAQINKKAHTSIEMTLQVINVASDDLSCLKNNIILYHDNSNKRLQQVIDQNNNEFNVITTRIEAIENTLKNFKDLVTGFALAVSPT
jgi:hypothetical protein